MIKKKSISSLELFVLFIVLLLFLSRQEPLVWAIRGQRLLMGIVALIGFTYLTNSLTFRIFLREGKLLLIPLVYLLILLLAHHGSAEDITRLLLTYSLSTLIFIIGLKWGLLNKTAILNKFLFWLFVLSIAYLIPFILSSALTGNINKRALSLFFGLEESSMIMFWPLIYLISFFGFFNSFHTTLSKATKRILILLFILFLVLVIVSAFMAVFMMVVISFFLYYFFSKSKGQRVKGNLYLVAISLILFLVLNLVGSGTFGDLGGTTKKVAAFNSIFNAGRMSDREMMLNEASSTRYERFTISFDSFSESPVFGKGYFDKSSLLLGSDISSGHSSIFDFLAFFGVFAFLFYSIFINFIFKALQLWRINKDTSSSKIYSAFLAVFITYFAMSFFNPYLQFSTIDILFLIGGWTVGQLYYIKSAAQIKALS